MFLNVLVAELEFDKNAKVESGNLKKEVDTLKRKIEEISVRSKNISERGRSGNGIEQARLNNVKAKGEEGTLCQGL